MRTEPMNTQTLIQVGVISTSISLAACTADDVTNTTNASTTPTPILCGDSIYTLTWEWDSKEPGVTLDGFKLYYGDKPNLSKYSALGLIEIGGGTLAATFKPADYNIIDCSKVFIGISAIGTRPESALSEIISLANIK